MLSSPVLDVVAALLTIAAPGPANDRTHHTPDHLVNRWEKIRKELQDRQTENK